MVKNCFVPGCVTNKCKKQWKDKRPALFCFPKSLELLGEWKKRIPKREREPISSDSICSLHFKHTDVIKYYEITSLTGQPKAKIERIERGCWALEKNAIPQYFHNNNPDEELLVKTVKHRDQIEDHTYTTPPDSAFEVEDCPELNKHFLSDALMDHCYNLPVQMSEPESAVETESHDKDSVAERENHQLYTISDLHEDALDLTLPSRWSFIQNPEEDSTTFLHYGEDMSILCSVKFIKSCFPIIYVNSKTVLRSEVASKKEIQKLLEDVDGLKNTKK